MPVKKKELPSLSLITLSELGDIQFVSSGVKEIDELTKGFPRGRISEIHGALGIGKTSLMLMCLANMSQTAKVLYIDAENALNPSRLVQYGAKSKNVDISSEASLEAVAEFTTSMVNKYDIIVIDSVATLIPKTEAEGEVGDANVGLKARRMGAWTRKLIPTLGKSKCAFVFINQLRDSMEMYGAKQFTPGGHAIPYAASLRLKLVSNRADRQENGHTVHAEVVKSKVSKPYAKTSFFLEY